MARKQKGAHKPKGSFPPEERFTPAQVALAILEAQGNVSAASRTLGCTPNAVRAYIQRHEAVRAAYDRACAAYPEATRRKHKKPPRFTPEQVAEALRQAGGNLEAASRALDCGVGTLRRYIQRYPMVKEACEQARADAPQAQRDWGPSHPRYTPEQIATALAEAHGNQSAAARALGCSYVTVRRYLRDYPEIRKTYDQARRGLAEAGHWPATGSRPRYTPELVAEAVRKARGIHAVAARALGCKYSLIRHYIERYPVVREAAQEARAVRVDVAESRLAEEVLAGKWYAVSFVLRNLGADLGYGRRRPKVQRRPPLRPEEDPFWEQLQAEYRRLEALKAGRPAEPDPPPDEDDPADDDEPSPPGEAGGDEGEEYDR